MIILYIDMEETRINYATYLANAHNGMSYGSTIEFLDDDNEQAREDHSATMQEIMFCEVFGFNNVIKEYQTMPPMLVVKDLRLHEDGLLAYCKLMSENSCLVIRSGALERPNVVLELMNRVLLKHIEQLVVTNTKTAFQESALQAHVEDICNNWTKSIQKALDNPSSHAIVMHNQ